MLISFGFDKGAPPRNAAKVFDVRDLSHDTNSPWFKARQQEIADYAKQHPLQTVAVGCDKGEHRSKVMVDRVAGLLHASKFHRNAKRM